MSLATYYESGKFGLSFELFPPKTSAGEEALMQHVRRLMTFQPDFITCTYGAGGSTRNKTLDIVERIKQTFKIPVASHLTCVNSTVDELRDYLVEAQRRNVDYIVALRGDPPHGQDQFRPVAGGLRYASELVRLVRSEFSGFDIAVAGYPETHQEAPSSEVDLQHLKHKVDTGADIIITQLFYDNEKFFRFRDRCQKKGICVPLVPGILPVTNLAQIRRISSLCGAHLPRKFVHALSEYDDKLSQFEVGVSYSVDQIQDLIRAGVPSVHYYVLNKSKATSAVLEAVGRP